MKLIAHHPSPEMYATGKRTICWSYGGGIQSVAIAVLIRTGALPVPDLAVIADTSRERQSTWDYLYGVLQPYLDPIGLKIQVAPHSLSRVDLYAKDGLTLMPAYTEEGRLSSYCSGEWKRDTVNRWYRLQGVKECDSWIGYSLDEQHRALDRRGNVKDDRRDWCHIVYPLLEKRVTRAMCIRMIEAAGLPVPKKSRCWCCPHQTAEEWQEVREHPEEWAAALSLEKQINENDPEQGKLFLYRGRVPLEMANFKDDSSLVAPLFNCEGANCWT